MYNCAFCKLDGKSHHEDIEDRFKYHLKHHINQMKDKSITSKEMTEIINDYVERMFLNQALMGRIR